MPGCSGRTAEAVSWVLPLTDTPATATLPASMLMPARLPPDLLRRSAPSEPIVGFGRLIGLVSCMGMGFARDGAHSLNRQIPPKTFVVQLLETRRRSRGRDR